MSWRRQSGALCFGRNDRGETVFYFPGLAVVPGQGYIVTSDADAAKLKKALDAYNRTLLWVIVVVVISGVHLFDAAENLFLFMAISLGILWIYRETCKFLFFRPILRNCERTPDKLGYIAAREIQAAVLSWRILYFQAAVLPLLFAAAVAASFWPAVPAELRIALPILIGLAGLNIVHLFVLKRRRAGGKAAAPTA